MKRYLNWLFILSVFIILVPMLAAADEAPVAKSVIQTATKVVPAGAPVVVNKIEIWVGNEIITTLDIETPLKQYREHFSLEFRGPELEEKMKEVRSRHVERMIESKLLLLEARDQKIEVQDTLVEEQVQKEMEALQAQFPTHQAYKEQLAKDHLTEAEFRKQREQVVRETLMRQRLLQTKIQEFKTGVEVSDKQLKDYYEKRKEKFTRPSRVHLRQIFVARPDTGLSADEFKRRDAMARRKIQQALDELKAGKDFADVARRYSEHKVTAEKGGDIGWIEEGDIELPQFEKIAFYKLTPGQYSGIIDTVRGYFVIQLEDKQQGGQMPFAEVRGRIRKEMMAESSDKRYKAWLETLKKKFKVKYAEKSS